MLAITFCASAGSQLVSTGPSSTLMPGYFSNTDFQPSAMPALVGLPGVPPSTMTLPSPLSCLTVHSAIATPTEETRSVATRR